MPIISTFYGIIIKMYFQQSEHNPPHFHAIYGEYVGAFDIKTLEMVEGDFLPKDRRLFENGRKNIKTIC
jgi:hypothetical protein